MVGLYQVLTLTVMAELLVSISGAVILVFVWSVDSIFVFEWPLLSAFSLLYAAGWQLCQLVYNLLRIYQVTIYCKRSFNAVYTIMRCVSSPCPFLFTLSCDHIYIIFCGVSYFKYHCKLGINYLKNCPFDHFSYLKYGYYRNNLRNMSHLKCQFLLHIWIVATIEKSE